MERDCAKLTTVISDMEEHGCVACTGSKGAGKSTTVVAAHNLAHANGKKAVYIDLKRCNDVDYKNCSGAGCYFFIDNAQKLKHFVNIPGLLVEGKVCLTFSSSVMEDSGNSLLNCPIPIWKRLAFTPFNARELQEYLPTGKAYHHVTTLPYIVSRCVQCDMSYNARCSY